MNKKVLGISLIVALATSCSVEANSGDYKDKVPAEVIQMKQEKNTEET